MRILVIAPDPRDGTSMYRAIGPFGKMAKMHPELFIRHAKPGEAIGWDTISDIDVVFMQRPFDPAHVHVAKICNDFRMPLVVDYDDNYFDIKEHNPAHKFYSNPYSIELIRQLIDLADEAWFGTIPLKECMGSDKTPSYHIPNAINTDLYPMQKPKFRDVVVWRGGASHDMDLKLYKEQIFSLVKKFPDHEFVFMGHCPEFISDHIPASQLTEVRFSSFPRYMRMLMELAPKLIIVPMEDSDFNRSRGDSAWLEGTVAGCPVLAPSFMPAFGAHEYIIKYKNQDDFYVKAVKAIQNPREGLVKNAQDALYPMRDLRVTVEMRKERLETLVSNYQDYVTPNDINIETAGADEEYLDTYRMGFSLDSEKLEKNVKGVVDAMVKEFDIKYVLEAGCGNGRFLAEFLKQEDVIAHGVDLNPNWKKAWDDRYPEQAGYFILGDFAEIKFEDHVDMLLCVEVLEHLDDVTAETWVARFADLTKWVVFSSVPYSEGPSWDKYWGHKNLKPMNHWVQLFKKYGFTLVRKQQPPAPWGMLFINTKF